MILTGSLIIVTGLAICTKHLDLFFSFTCAVHLHTSTLYTLNLLCTNSIGSTWAMGECIEAGELEAVDNITPLPPAVVNQHSQPPRQFIVLTTQVITMFFTLTCPASHVFTFSLTHPVKHPIVIHSLSTICNHIYICTEQEGEGGREDSWGVAEIWDHSCFLISFLRFPTFLFVKNVVHCSSTG